MYQILSFVTTYNSNCGNRSIQCGYITHANNKNSDFAVIPRLAGKNKWREFPVAITDNYRPKKYSKFRYSGKYWEI